ncbi:MAG TPA: hypothetical protein VGY76_14035 [Solirubrobacteraceae bacterium]|jgi:hypothetical protein|nr:hypothetical protein [Solirubrobacteraceae bacterium]
MNKTKMALGLMMMVGVFAFTASSALAIWTNAGSKGSGEAGPGTFTYSALGSVKCEKAEGTYTVSSNGGQVKLSNITWNTCKTSFGGAATVSCKGLVMTQQAKEGTVSGKATGSVSEVCTVTGGGCIITISPQENPNPLKTITLAKVTEGQEDNVNVSGITATAKNNGAETCFLGSKTTAAEEKVPKLLLKGVGLE